MSRFVVPSSGAGVSRLPLAYEPCRGSGRPARLVHHNRVCGQPVTPVQPAKRAPDVPRRKFMDAPAYLHHNQPTTTKSDPPRPAILARFVLTLSAKTIAMFISPVAILARRRRRPRAELYWPRPHSRISCAQPGNLPAISAAANIRPATR